MTLCTHCGINEAPPADSIEEDPMCNECIRGEIRKRVLRIQCRGCKKPFIAQKLSDRQCPGWNDSCNNTLTPGSDLCPDCTMGRMNAQSPRLAQ